MAEQLGRKQIQHYARLGAEARLAALELEREAILRSFPDLARRRNARGAAAGTESGGGGRRGRRKSHMSAAARKAVSVRMKKYWASRRKAKAAAKNA